MANTLQSNGPQVPSRAASLQRMLEMERKQKMARMQQNPYAAGPGRRSESPAARPKPNLLTRRRDSSQPPQDDKRRSTMQNPNLPPLSINTLQVPATHDRFARQPGQRPAPLKEMRKGSADRDSLPSMKRAAAGQGSPHLKVVTFHPSDDGQSETSSICHSPTWDDYGKKKRKEKESAAAAAAAAAATTTTTNQAKLVKKRPTKEPPPSAIETRPTLTTRAVSAPLLDHMSFNEAQSSDQHPADVQSETSRPQNLGVPGHQGSVETVHAAVRSPAFMGGVRLERERDAAMQRLANARAPSAERPSSGVLAENQTSRPGSKEKTQGPAATSPTSYPPTASKTPLLNQPPPVKGQNRKRSGSLGSVVSKLFSSSKNAETSKPRLDRRASQESVHTVSSLFSLKERGRKRSESGSSQTRAQSYDLFNRSGASTPMSERRGALNLPPLAWKNGRKNRTTSMMAIPPDSARDASFSSEETSGLKQDNFTFLERPFSPPVETPLSPAASLSASIKAKISPQATPASGARPVSHMPKKTFKEAIKAGFRVSAGPEVKASHRHTGTDDRLTAADLMSDSHPPQRNARGSDEQSARQQNQDSKDSGASLSSSHPDTESIPPSPMTTPDTSRPQSLKDNQPYRVDELRKTPLVSMHGASGLGLQNPSAAVVSSNSNISSRENSPRIDIDFGTGGFSESWNIAKEPSSRFAEGLARQQPQEDELWPLGGKPLDMDQLSFTSALTSLDVKTSFQDLASPLSDMNSFSQDRGQSGQSKGTKVTLRGIKVEVVKSPAYAKKGNSNVPSPTSDTSFLPTLRHQALSPRTNNRPAPTLLVHNEIDERSVMAQTRDKSPDACAGASAASRHLQQARKVAPASPRSPTAVTNNSTTSHLSSTLAPAKSRPFALASQPKPSGGPAVPSLQHSNLDTTGLKPIAKMFVECCSCKFYQDMPSRVYEAMARPEDTVRDKRLGVSGQVTTCVKCPWCSHNMSTQCCAGYAAVVYLSEKLHGP